MISLLSKNQMMRNKKGQVIIINIVMLVMALLVFMAMVPIMKTSIDSARNYDSFNCADSTRVCGAAGIGMASPCYNATYSKSETFACTMLDLYLPYILIIVLLAGAAKLMANRVDSMFTSNPYGQ